MKHSNQKSGDNPVRRGILLLISTGAALCLFLTTSKITIALELAIFCLAAFTLIVEKAAWKRKPFQAAAALLALSFEAVGVYTFVSAWQHSGILASLAAVAGLPVKLLTVGIAGVGGMAAWYAFYRLAAWMQERMVFLWETQGRHPRQAVLLAASSGAFFLLMPELAAAPVLYMLPASILVGMAAWYGPNLRDSWRQSPWWMQILSILTGAGICLFRAQQVAISGVAGSVLGLLGMVFVCSCLLLFYRYLKTVLSGVFSRMGRGELLCYGTLLLVLIAAMCWVFLSTDAFYGTEHPYDVIYTSDSPILVGSNTWLNLTYSQNDLRQPLFAVFAAPFMGIFHLADAAFGGTGAIHAILLNIPQIGILLVTALMLATALELSGPGRVGFVLLCCSSYSFLLFGLMMEQYIIACFYLVLMLWQLSQNQKPRLSFWGAGGTLLTSIITLPLLSDKNPVLSFPVWYRDMRNRAMEFVIVMIAFCRLDIILGIADGIVNMGQFTGEKLTWADKLWQYLAFLPGCLLAPAAGADFEKVGFPSWQLAAAEGVHLGGVLILLLCALSLWLNRKDRVSCLCGGWMVFSFLLLFGLGWGTQENGLVLYALYFGWAILALLYRLIQWGEKRLARANLATMVTAAAAIVMAVYNLSALGQMIRFAITYYPL